MYELVSMAIISFVILILLLDFDHMHMFTELSISTYTCESFIYFYYFFKLYSASQMVWPEREKRKGKALRPMWTLGRSREGKSMQEYKTMLCKLGLEPTVYF